ncbi:MAG: efflux RND transporter periplasmic adaptor subunit [Chitinispirillaceae bacterium]|nr:efflux RND transporter periplasmic adaptor subunit [Chitinispirillaceae bacterium]
MKKKWIVGPAAAVLLGAAAFGVALLRQRSAGVEPEYTTVPVERGEIVNSITSTGTLEPVSIVEVGTQVSGIIDKLYADFNDVVEKGQLIAELDRTVLSGALDEAIANRNRVKALFDLAQAELKRNEPLFKKGFLSEQEFTKLRTDYITQEAMLHSAEASVVKARTNLHYATITSPINGTVIQRNIEVGQTVAASFSAPTLFVIAEDLRRMQILASVDEADIGVIRQGQEVRFTVQAFPEKKFSGLVEQVRLQPTVSQNVVTYTVVITTRNSDGTLLPGMTATVDFIVEKAVDVLMVPNAALRFNPSGDSARRPLMRVAKRERDFRKSGGEMQRDSLKAMRRPRFEKQAADTARGKRGVVWIWVSGIPLRAAYIRTGITDGKMTEVRSGAAIAESTLVITGIKTTPKKKIKSVSLLPQPGRPGRRR